MVTGRFSGALNYTVARVAFILIANHSRHGIVADGLLMAVHGVDVVSVSTHCCISCS